MEVVFSLLAGVAAAFLGSLGLGGGGILILYLTAFLNMPQIQAQGINLLFFIPTAVLSIWMHNKNHLIDKSLSLKALPYGLMGIAAGIGCARLLPETWLSKLFAVFLIVLAVKDLFTKKPKSPNPPSN